MRTTVYKSGAARLLLGAVMLLLLITIWPGRVWERRISFDAPEEAAVSETREVNDTSDVTQRFIAQYDRLGAVELYLYPLKYGRYLSLSVINGNYETVYEAFVDCADFDLPGYVRIPTGVELEVGEEYTLLLLGCYSTYTVGAEDRAGAADTGRLLTDMHVHDTTDEAHVLSLALHYTQPLSRTVSLALMALAAALWFAADRVLKRREEKEREYGGAVTLLTKGQVIGRALNVVILAGCGALFICNLPLLKFDTRITDVIFYAAGIALACVLMLVLVREVTGGDALSASFPGKERMRAFLMAGLIALSIHYACDYMNGLFDIYHSISERKLMLCLLGVLLLTFSFREAVSVFPLLCTCGALAGAVYFGRDMLISPDEREADLRNLVTKLSLAVFVLAVFVISAQIRSFIGALAAKKEERIRVRLTGYGWLTLALFAMLVIFRNGRMWGVALSVVFAVFILRFAMWRGSGHFTTILAGGLALHFVCSFVYCLCHRVFAGFVSARFAFVFHTVTVTAEYLTMVTGVAAALLLASGRKGKRSVYPLWLLFGVVTAYAVFTMSRTAYLAIGGMCVLLLLVSVLASGAGKAARGLLYMVSALILCFPAVFALQRTIPAIVNRPYVFQVEDTSAFLRGHASWDHPHYMSAERFTAMFSEKILGKDAPPYAWPIDRYNYDEEGNPVYGPNGVPLTGAGVSVIGEDALPLSEGPSSGETFDADAFSNGRLTIWRCYLDELNLNGHETMGAELPNGEVAVHAHNTYLQVAFDHGIIVGVLFLIWTALGLCYGVMYAARGIKRGRESALLPLALNLGFAIAGLTEWVFMFANPMTIALLFGTTPLMLRKTKVRREREV